MAKMFERSDISNSIILAVKDHMKKNVGIFHTLGMLAQILKLPKEKMYSNMKDSIIKDLEQEGFIVEKCKRVGFRIVAEDKSSAYQVKAGEPTVSIVLKEKPPETPEISDAEMTKVLYAVHAVREVEAFLLNAQNEEPYILIYNKKKAKLIGPDISQDFDVDEMNFNCKYTKEQGVTVDMRTINSYKF